MLDEGFRRRLEQREHQSLGKAHPLTPDICPGLLPHVQGFRIVAEVNADLLQNALGIGHDEADLVLGKRLIELHLAADETSLVHRGGGAGGTARISPATGAAGGGGGGGIGHV